MKLKHENLIKMCLFWNTNVGKLTYYYIQNS